MPYAFSGGISMRFLLGFMLFLTTAGALARPQDELQIEVRSFDDNADLSTLRDRRYKPVNDSAPPSYHHEMPSVNDRDALLERAGLKVATREMDDMDKDMLWRRAMRLELEAFRKEYSYLPSEGITNFHELVRGRVP